MKTGLELRLAARLGQFTGQTAGQAPDHLQGNVVVLPRSDAGDFLRYCLNNPKPCPLVGIAGPGDPTLPTLGEDLDVRSDVPQYRIFENGLATEDVTDIKDHWQGDFVTFVLGCSFTFEDALTREGYGVRHIEQGRNVPMFNTSIQTIPGGKFSGPLVVTMRPYPEDQISQVYDICAKYPFAHGAPVYWGDPVNIGIEDLQKPDYGDAVDLNPGEIPVFWACGVTPQAAIKAAKPDLCITHVPGHMLVADVPSDAPPRVITRLSEIQG